MTQFSTLWGARLDRELATDDRTILFTTARRQAAINEAQDAFADATECYVRSATVTVVGGTDSYDLTSTGTIAGGDYVRLAREPVTFYSFDGTSSVWSVLSGDDFQQRTVAWLQRNEPGWLISTTSSGLTQTPRYYYVNPDGGGQWLGFWPTPSTGPGIDLLAVVPYVARPVPMATSTSEPYTETGVGTRTDLRVYHQGLVHYAAYLLEKLRRDGEASGQQLQQYLNYVTRYLTNTRIRGGQAITSARLYFARRRASEGDPRT